MTVAFLMPTGEFLSAPLGLLALAGRSAALPGWNAAVAGRAAARAAAVAGPRALAAGDRRDDGRLVDRRWRARIAGTTRWVVRRRCDGLVARRIRRRRWCARLSAAGIIRLPAARRRPRAAGGIPARCARPRIAA